MDEEIQALPERFRLPILLCGLEGLSRAAAAARLGWSPGSLKGRLERGRQMLHARLARRGLVLPAGLTLGLLSATTPPRSLPPRRGRVPCPRRLPSPAGSLAPGRILRLVLLVAGAVGLGFATTVRRHRPCFPGARGCPANRPSAPCQAGRRRCPAAARCAPASRQPPSSPRRPSLLRGLFARWNTARLGRLGPRGHPAVEHADSRRGSPARRPRRWRCRDRLLTGR